MATIASTNFVFLISLYARKTLPNLRGTLRFHRATWAVASSHIRQKNFSSNGDYRNNDGVKSDTLLTKIHSVTKALTNRVLERMSLEIHLYLLKTYFDRDFDKSEFLRGVKQALVVTSGILAEKRFTDMLKISTTEFVNLIEEAVKTRDPGPPVKFADIVTTELMNIELTYTDTNEKQIDVDVRFLCLPLKHDTWEVGNVKIINIRHGRILQYRFRKFCVPGKDSWLVVGMDL